MADELVYRIVLDGQDESSGSSRPFPSSPSRSPRTIAEEDPMAVAYRTAQARRERENAAELADQVYRAMRRGVKPSVIEDEDHQAKLDKQEAEQEAIREKARKEAERQAELAQRRQIAAEERQARDEDWLERDQIRQRDQEAARKLRDEERQERDEDWYARDQIRQQREADTERQKQQAEKQSKDPVYLAQEAINRERLMEQTRLQYEATKRGTTPEDIAREERIRETAKNAAGYLNKGANLIGSGVNGGPMGLIGALGNLNPLTAPISNLLTGMIGSFAEADGRMREQRMRSARFSPEFQIQKAANKQAEIKQDMDWAEQKGAKAAEIEKRLAELDRISKQLDLDFMESGAAEIAKLNEIAGKRARNWANRPMPAEDDPQQGLILRMIRDTIKEKEKGMMNGIPKPFEFKADKAKELQGMKVPQIIQGVMNLGMQLPGQ